MRTEDRFTLDDMIVVVNNRNYKVRGRKILRRFVFTLLLGFVLMLSLGDKWGLIGAVIVIVLLACWIILHYRSWGKSDREEARELLKSLPAGIKEELEPV